MSEKYSYSAQREVITFVYLYVAATDALNKAKTIEEGSFYQMMSALVFSAFAVEACLNHVGEKKIEFWDEIETIKPLSKLKVLFSYLKLDFDTSRRPLQTIKLLFKFRNLMAHGRTEKIEKSGTRKKPKLSPDENLIEAQWQKFCTIKNAQRAIEDVEVIIEDLCKAAGLDPPGLLSSSFYAIGNAEE